MRRHEALGEEQISLRLSVNVRDAPAVAQDFDFFLESFQSDRALDLRKTGTRLFSKSLFGLQFRLGHRAACGSSRDHGKTKQESHSSTAAAGSDPGAKTFQ